MSLEIYTRGRWLCLPVHCVEWRAAHFAGLAKDLT